MGRFPLASLESQRMHSRFSPALVLILGLVTACQGAATDGNSPTGGTRGGAGGGAQAGAGGGRGGAPGTGGSSASGGAGGSAAVGTGGNSGGGAGMGGAGGQAGADGGSDAAAMPGDGGAVGGARPVKASAGCGKALPASGARTIMTGGRQANFVVNLPAGYDNKTPLPLGFAFHGHSNPLCTGECAGFRDLKAVTVFPKSLAAGWEDNPNPLLGNITFFEDLVALMKSESCVDENRIFVAGVSSGGQFVEHLACKHGDWLWAVSPVAAYVDRGVDMNCKGTPPHIVIHGVTDRAGMFGQAVAALYAKRNGCSDSPPPGLAMARADMMAAFTARRAEHRCLDWEGCTANPVRYCISSQITYSGLTHGWPRVGGMLIGDFLAGLK
jgi:polyhydroxybutyrate depolymerase